MRAVGPWSWSVFALGLWLGCAGAPAADAGSGGGARGGGAPGGGSGGLAGGAAGGGIGGEGGAGSGADAGLGGGASDAGIDAGVPTVSLRAPCTDAVTDVRGATSSGGPLGARLFCATDQSLPEGETYFLAYRTTRADGAPGAGTARVFIPKSPRAAPTPLVVVAHPSVGVADKCAPSRETRGVFDLALPFVNRGYPVIAPDYAGLGNPGTHAYVNNHDLAYSVLDAARALAQLLSAGAHDGRVVLLGYSEGGGAVLAAQALERSYGTAGALSAVVAFAAQYHVRLDSFGYVTMLRSPDALTISSGYTKPVVAALRQFGWYDTYLGAGRGGDAFPAANRADTVMALESQCLIALGAWLPSTRTRIRDLIDDELRQTFLTCVDAPTSAGCRDPGRRYHRSLLDDVVPGDPMGAPVLYVQGMFDTVMPVGEEAACVVPALRAAGVPLELCLDSGGNHANIVDRHPALAADWAEAVLAGQTRPSCSSSATLPACPAP